MPRWIGTRRPLEQVVGLPGREAGLPTLQACDEAVLGEEQRVEELVHGRLSALARRKRKSTIAVLFTTRGVAT